MAVGTLADAGPGERVLDLCAAPGGKTTQAAERLGLKGLLVSNEIHAGRAKILSGNVERMGFANTVVTNETSVRMAEAFPEFFDKVLIDAPCSGEGMFRKDRDMVKDWEKIQQLGSIRSVRPTNVRIAAEWNAVLCHDGGPFYVDQYMAQPFIDNFSGTFSRVDNGKPREYTEYILPGDLEKNFERSGVEREYTSYYEGPHYQFAREDNPVDLSAEAGVIDARTVDLPFPHNDSILEYNEEEQIYYYSEYGKAHVDPGNDNKQLSFKNLLIQSCGFTQYDEHGYMIFDCVSTGGGYYVTNGKAIPVTWTKTSDTSPTRYYDGAGNEIKLNTGKTYVGFVPVDNWTEVVIE